MFQDELEDEEGRNNIFITEFQGRKQVDVTAAGLEGNEMATDLHLVKIKRNGHRSAPCKDIGRGCIFLS